MGRLARPALTFVTGPATNGLGPAVRFELGEYGQAQIGVVGELSLEFGELVWRHPGSFQTRIDERVELVERIEREALPIALQLRGHRDEVVLNGQLFGGFFGGFVGGFCGGARRQPNRAR
jgi:hypothetical protein